MFSGNNFEIVIISYIMSQLFKKSFINNHFVSYAYYYNYLGSIVSFVVFVVYLTTIPGVPCLIFWIYFFIWLG